MRADPGGWADGAGQTKEVLFIISINGQQGQQVKVRMGRSGSFRREQKMQTSHSGEGEINGLKTWWVLAWKY